MRRFKYLGSFIEDGGGGVDGEVAERITREAKAFGCVREAMFCNGSISLKTKQVVCMKQLYWAFYCYSAETWIIKQRACCKLEVFRIPLCPHHSRYFLNTAHHLTSVELDSRLP